MPVALFPAQPGADDRAVFLRNEAGAQPQQESPVLKTVGPTQTLRQPMCCRQVALVHPPASDCNVHGLLGRRLWRQD